MEASGLLNVEDPINLFTLHTIFIPRINKALEDFSEAFNNDSVSTEGNWTPYQMWMNGMMHRNNGALDGEPDGPPPLDETNNVVVEPIACHTYLALTFSFLLNGILHMA